jgi:hypothetical protein
MEKTVTILCMMYCTHKNENVDDVRWNSTSTFQKGPVFAGVTDKVTNDERELGSEQSEEPRSSGSLRNW